MNEFQFRPEIAALYGVNEAIFLHSLSFWIVKNWSNRANYHEGRYWSYDTYKDIAKRFPFWTARQVERIVSNCEDKGAILVGHFSEDKTCRTKWYTLAGKAEEIYLTETVNCNPPNGEMDVPQSIDGAEKQDDCNSPNCEMQLTKEGVAIHQTVKCNKETVTNPGIYNPPISPQQKKSQLSETARAMLNDYVRGDPELAEAMVLYMEVRENDKKTKQTDRAVKMLLRELEELSGGDRDTRVRIVRQSALSGWVGLFPLRTGQGRGVDRQRRREEVPDW